MKMESKKLFIGPGCLAALALAAFGIFAACENTVQKGSGNRNPIDEFPDEEYGEDWGWPELPPLVLSQTEVILGAGDTVNLTATVEGKAAEVWWTSNKAGAVSAAADGTVTAYGQGAADTEG